MVQKQTKFVAFIASTLFVAATIALIYGWYELQAKSQAIEATAAAVGTSLAQGEAYEELVSQLEATTAEREKLMSYMLAEDETVGFLATLETIAAEQGIEFTTNTLTLADSTEQKQLEINFAVAGNESSVLQFIHILELLPYHSRLQSISIDRSFDAATGVRQLRADGRLFISVINAS